MTSILSHGTAVPPDILGRVVLTMDDRNPGSTELAAELYIAMAKSKAVRLGEVKYEVSRIQIDWRNRHVLHIALLPTSIRNLAARKLKVMLASPPGKTLPEDYPFIGPRGVPGFGEAAKGEPPSSEPEPAASISAVNILPERHLWVTWAANGKSANIDLQEAMGGKEAYREVVDSDAVFASGRLAEGGMGVEWANGATMAAELLVELAYDQGQPTPED